MQKTSIILLIIAIVMFLISCATFVVYKEAFSSAIAYEVGSSIGAGTCQTAYKTELDNLSKVLEEKGEISLFNKVLVEKKQEEK